MLKQRILHSYMDDSGTHSGAPISIIAGYFGGWRRWLEFELAWKAVLDKYEVCEFHARKFWNRNKDPRRKPKPGRDFNQFDGWSDEKARAFLDELLTVIENSDAIYPFACGVRNEEWDKQTLEHRRVLSGGSSKHSSGKPSKSMFLPFQRCVIRIAENHCKPGVRAEFFIDSDKQTDAWATICYYDLKNLHKAANDPIHLAMGELTPVDPVKANPVQAADLLAYEARLYAEHVLGHGTENDMRVIYVRALRHMISKEDFVLFDETRFDTLQRMLREI